MSSSATPWTVAHQAPLVHGILQARRIPTEVGCHSLLKDIFPDPGIKPRSPALQTDSLLSEPPGKPKSRLYFENKKKKIFTSSSQHLCSIVWLPTGLTYLPVTYKKKKLHMLNLKNYAHSTHHTYTHKHLSI